MLKRYIYEFRSKTNSRKWHTGNSYSTVYGVVSLEYGVNTKVPHESWLKKSLKEKKPNRLHKNAQVNEPSLNPVHNGSQSDEQIMATGDCNTRLLYLYKIIYIYTHLCTHTLKLHFFLQLLHFSLHHAWFWGEKKGKRERKKIDGIKFTRVVGFLSLIKVCFLYKRKKNGCMHVKGLAQEAKCLYQ